MMLLRWLKNPKALVFAPLILVMIAAVACGGAATMAPEQAAAPTASSGAGPTASSGLAAVPTAMPAATTAPERSVTSKSVNVV